MRKFAIIYKKEWLNSSYAIFIPSFVIEGEEYKGQQLFLKKDDIYHSFYSYDKLELSDEFYNDVITEKELLDLYDTDDVECAVNKYFEEISDNIVVGHIDSSKSTIELCNLPLYKIEGLTKSISYGIDSNGMAEICLTKSQLQSLLLESDLKSLKKQLSMFLERIDKLEKMNTERGITEIKINALGKQLISFSKVDKQKSKEELEKINNETKKDIINDENIALKTYQYIASRLIGQDEAVEDIVGAIISNMKALNHQEIIKPFIIGPTGSGKSLLFKLLGECLQIPVIIVDCNTIVQSGYEVKDIEDVLRDLYELCANDIFKTEHAIVFLDEIDKIASRGASVSDIGAQNTLLKFIEGSKYVIKLDKLGSEKITIDTSMMTIAAGGAFDKLTTSQSKTLGFNNNIQKNSNNKIKTDDLKKYGMISELLARFNLFVQYNSVTEEMLYESLTSSEISPLKIKQAYYLRTFNIKLVFNEDYIRRICKDAIALNSGFRGIEKAVNTSLSKLNFKLQCSSNSYSQVIVDESIIDNPRYYMLKK